MDHNSKVIYLSELMKRPADYNGKEEGYSYCWADVCAEAAGGTQGILNGTLDMECWRNAKDIIGIRDDDKLDFRGNAEAFQRSADFYPLYATLLAEAWGIDESEYRP